jgi:hypothetical protein
VLLIMSLKSERVLISLKHDWHTLATVRHGCFIHQKPINVGCCVGIHAIRLDVLVAIHGSDNGYLAHCRTAWELHYHLNASQPRVNSACRAIVLLVNFVLDFVGSRVVPFCRYAML